ncbi:MAG: hypothetical protein RML35_11045 [Chloroherpetonaceae bacterium]|nr:hypothetical protein [Chloroherpetonaceae bacterium]
MHITIAFSCFLVNFLYGILAKLRVVDAARFKVVHHVMYFFVMASLVAAVSLEIYERGVPVPLLVMVVALLGMTRFSGKFELALAICRVVLGDVFGSGRVLLLQVFTVISLKSIKLLKEKGLKGILSQLFKQSRQDEPSQGYF